MRALSSMLLSGTFASDCLFGIGYFLLKFHHAIEKSLGPGRTTRYVNVHRNYVIDSLNGGVVVVKTARAGTHSEGNNPFWIAHLFVDSQKNRRNFFADRTDHQKHVRLSRRKPGQSGAKAVQVIVRRASGHVFHSATCGYEWIIKNGIFPCPSDQIIQAAGYKSFIHQYAVYRHDNTPFFHA